MNILVINHVIREDMAPIDITVCQMITLATSLHIVGTLSLSESTRGCWPDILSEKHVPIAVLFGLPSTDQGYGSLPVFELICGPLGYSPDTIKRA